MCYLSSRQEVVTAFDVTIRAEERQEATFSCSPLLGDSLLHKCVHLNRRWSCAPCSYMSPPPLISWASQRWCTSITSSEGLRDSGSKVEFTSASSSHQPGEIVPPSVRRQKVQVSLESPPISSDMTPFGVGNTNSINQSGTAGISAN